MKKLAVSLILVLIAFIFASCESDEIPGASCTDDSLKRSTSILLGDVLERCVNGKWYAVRRCGESADCSDQANHPGSGNIDL